jgi:hypothetical protein
MSEENTNAQDSQDSQEPKPAAQTEPKPEAQKPDAQADALKKQLDDAKAMLAKYQEKEKAAAEAEKSKDQRLAERETEISNLKRQHLISQVRLDHGFTDAVFNAVQPSGDDADSIKAAFESHKANLDAYIKAQGSKPGQGGGTETQAGKPQQEKTTASLGFLERHNLLQNKAAI